MNNTKMIHLQVPMTKTLKLRGVKRAREYGYTSLQEIIRVFVTGFARGQYFPIFESGEEEVLSRQAQERYAKMIAEHEKDVKKGTVKKHTFEEAKKILE